MRRTEPEQTLAATVRTPVPAAPQPKKSNGAMIAAVIILFFVLAGGAAVGAYLYWPKITAVISSTMSPKKPQVAQTRQIVTTAPVKVSESAINVTPAETTSSATPLITKTDAPPVGSAHAEHPLRTQPAADDSTPPPERQRPSRYVEGADRPTRNERAVDRLREELRGVKQVSLLAGSDQVMVYRAIHRVLPDLEFDADSPVVIKFGSTADRLGYDSQHLGAGATIEKNGHVIFRYNFPYSSDRVAAAEGFAQTLAEALGE